MTQPLPSEGGPGAVHRFMLPRLQADYRCGACGRTWRRRGPRTAIGSDGSTRRRSPSGWFRCCADRFFCWEDNLS